VVERLLDPFLSRLSALDRKLFRDLKSMLGQGITISLVVAAGIAGFITLRSTHGSLVESRDAYYERYRFGDAFVGLERAPESLGARLERVPGVALAYTRVVATVRIPMEGAAQSPIGQVVTLPPDGTPPLNAIFLREGRLPEPGRADEALLLEAFANRRDIGPGDTLRVVMNGTLRPVRITGLATSPEFIYPIPPGGTGIGDDERFAVLWMDRGAAAPIFRMEGAFNDVVFRLQRGASERAVLHEVDALLEPYGGRGAVGRANQPSNAILAGELAQLQQFATVVPLIFLGVAAFLLNVVLSRLLNLQRTQIAALKALGYRDREIGFHYLKMTSGVMLAGSLLGLALGAWLGSATTNLYATFFGFPVLEFRVGWGPALAGVGSAFGAGGIGAFGALRKILRLSPAEAMNPEPPARYRPSLPERIGLGRLVGPTGRMVLREIGRRRLRTALSALGIAMAVAILVVGRFTVDALDFLIDHQFYRAWKEDVTVTFTGPVPERAVRELLPYPGVRRAEGMRTTSARIHHGPRSRDVPLQGYPEGAMLRVLVDERGASHPLPRGGLVITGILGEILDVRPGDTVRVTLREGRAREASLVIAGLVDEMFGLQGHMRLSDLNALLGEEPRVTQALLMVDGDRFGELEARLAGVPRVADVGSRDALIQGFRDQSAQYLLVMMLIMTAFASVIAAGVVYNNARVAVAERERDLASLRVLGFTRREISAVLLGEMAVHVFLAIPIGLWVGYRLCVGIAATVDPEMFRLPVVLSPRTYAFAVSVVLLAAVVSALLVRRRLDALDLIGVLKTRE
jgi:putative ABC transport system permease protein